MENDNLNIWKGPYPLNPEKEKVEEETFNPNRNILTLSKREYFAGLAMQGMLVSESENYNYDYNYEEGNNYLADKAVKIADALLNELSKTKTNE